MVDRENIESIAGLAAMQKGMFFSYAVDTESDAYVEQFDFTGSGPLDPDHLRTALDALSRHYSALRTIFSFRNTDEPFQVVLKEHPLPLDVLDYRDQPDVHQAVTEFKATDRERGFDLSASALLRAAFIRIDDQRWHLIITFHHIILDGWSLGPLFGTLFGYYDELHQTGSYQQRYEEHPYRDYIAWYERQRGEDARRYWADVLEGFERDATLPSDATGKGYESATYRFQLSADLYDRLKQCAQQAKITQNAIFQAAWGVVLQKFTYTDDVVFGSVVSGRSIDLDGVEGMLGLFVNTQPVRVTTPPDGVFLDLCRTVQESYRGANPYEYYPLHEIQSGTALRGGLLDHVVAFENYPLSEQLQDFGSDGSGVRLDGVDVFERTNYDFHVVVNPEPDYTVTFTYNANRYAPSMMEALGNSLVKVFSAVVDDPKTRVADIALAEPASTAPQEAEQTARSLDTSIPDMFAAAVGAHGDGTAVEWQGAQYSYRDINRWSDAVAWQLQSAGVTPGTGVGILADRRPELVVAMIGVLKNGNYYIPIDPKDATSRISYVLEDAGTPYLCTAPELVERAPESASLVMIEPPTSEVPEFPREDVNGTDIAYLMYTSGSTGQPKGCYITHRNIARLVTGQEFFDFGPSHTILQTSSPAFDACTFEVWGSLLFGATLVLPEELDILDGQRLRNVIDQHGVTAMWLTSPLFNQLCDYDPEIFAGLGHLLVGGSALSVPHIARVREACPALIITNGYGPTENTTFSTTHRITEHDLWRDRIPIGRSLNHSTAHVLDANLAALPTGAIGELCVGGDGVSAGYHDRPELNKTKFVTVPAVPGQRLYRTGDLVRTLPDGTVDYIGRADDQVKINGYRVEIGEVARALGSLDQVEDAAVIAAEESGEKRLLGFYVAGPAVSDDVIREALSQRVASYLVPATLVQLDKIPLNKNGKVDRTQLIEARGVPEADTPNADRLSGPTHTSELESMLQDIVSDVIGTDGVDIAKNFFDIGVTSLNLLAINNRLRKALGRDLPLTLYFECTSIAALAAHLQRLVDDDSAPAEEAPIEAPEEEQDTLMTTQLLRQFAGDSEGSLDND